MIGDDAALEVFVEPDAQPLDRPGVGDVVDAPFALGDCLRPKQLVGGFLKVTLQSSLVGDLAGTISRGRSAARIGAQCLRREMGNLLRFAVLSDREVFLLQVRDRVTFSVHDPNVERDHGDPGADDSRLRPLRGRHQWDSKCGCDEEREKPGNVRTAHSRTQRVQSWARIQ